MEFLLFSRNEMSHHLITLVLANKDPTIIDPTLDPTIIGYRIDL